MEFVKCCSWKRLFKKQSTYQQPTSIQNQPTQITLSCIKPAGRQTPYAANNDSPPKNMGSQQWRSESHPACHKAELPEMQWGWLKGTFIRMTKHDRCTVNAHGIPTKLVVKEPEKDFNEISYISNTGVLDNNVCVIIVIELQTCVF